MGSNALVEVEYGSRAWLRPTESAFPTVESLAQYEGVIRDMMTPIGGSDRACLFRGVSNTTYRLVPSIARRYVAASRPCWLTLDAIHSLETSATNEFIARAHLLLDQRSMPDPNVEDARSLHWWQHMQHYGAPTRLLDWTGSPYAALYFSVCDEPDADGAVWMINYLAVQSQMHDKYESAFALPKYIKQGRLIPLIASNRDSEWRAVWQGYVFMKRCVRPDERMVAQSGWYSCATTPECDHGEAIGAAIAEAGAAAHGVWAKRVIVPAERKPEILRDLFGMGISHATLFPGLLGFAQSLARWSMMLQPDDRSGYAFDHGLLRKSVKVDDE